jgi:superfamily I DNA and RNA helicase
VYVLGFQHAAPGGPAGDEVRKRNEAFVALTRTRLWCVVTGVGHAAPAFAELKRAAEQQPELCFPAFNQRQLHRLLDDEEASEPNGQPEDGRPTLFDGIE